MTRTQNSFLNMVSSLVATLLLPILNFITRSVFIRYLGTSYLGIEGIFTNVLSMLSLADLGFGFAISFALYKPLQEQDYPRLRALMKLYHQIYMAVGTIILVLGLCIIPLLPVLVKDYEKFAELGLNAVVIFLIYLANNVSSYWFFAYKTSFVQADQKSYLLTVVGYGVSAANSLCQIAALLLTHNFMVYLCVQIAFTVLRNVVNAHICDKRYPYLKELETQTISKEERHSIFKDCGALFFHTANSVIINATDTVILSSLIGLDIVGLYSNYLSVKIALETILAVFTSSIQASLGNVFASEDRKASQLLFRVVHIGTLFIYGIGAVGTAVLCDDFITLWIGQQYIVNSWTVHGITFTTPLAVLIGAEVFLRGLCLHCSAFRLSSGLFQELKYRPIASILVNLIVTLVLVPYLGICGCVIGTICSFMFTDLLIDPVVIHKKTLQMPVHPYYLHNVMYMGSVILAYILSRWLYTLVPLTGILGFLVHGLICVAVCMILFVLFFHRMEEFRYLTNTVRQLLRRYLLHKSAEE